MRLYGITTRYDDWSHHKVITGVSDDSATPFAGRGRSCRPCVHSDRQIRTDCVARNDKQGHSVHVTDGLQQKHVDPSASAVETGSTIAGAITD